MNKSIIDNISDENIINIAREADGIVDFYRRLGYKSQKGTPGKNTRKKIKERLKKLNITINKKEITNTECLIYSGSIVSDKLGFLGESKFVYLCANENINVSKPLYHDVPYDFIIEKNNKMVRIQVKASNTFKNGSTNFKIDKTKHDKDGWFREAYDENAFDYFFLYSIPLDEGYLVRNDNKNVSTIFIRKNDTKNKQKENIKFSETYLFEKAIKSLF